MIAQIVSGAISGLGKIGSMIAGNKRMRKLAAENKRILDKQASDNEAWYNRRYNEDALAQADAQRALTQVSDSIRQRNRQAAGTSAVMGGTGAQEAAARAQNNEAYSNTASSIAANAAANKNAIEQQYMANKQNIANQRMAVNNQQMGQVASASSEAGNAMGGIGSAIGSLFEKDDKPKTNDNNVKH